jgi:hypothetical protein
MTPNTDLLQKESIKQQLEKIKNFSTYTIVAHIPEVDKNGIIIISSH